MIQLFLENPQMATHPEILATLLSVEALEDNEVLIIEGARQISRINDPKHRSTFESIAKPKTVSNSKRFKPLLSLLVS